MSGVSRAGAGREGGLHAKGQAGVLVTGLSQDIFPVTCRQMQGHIDTGTHTTRRHTDSVCAKALKHLVKTHPVFQS